MSFVTLNKMATTPKLSADRKEAKAKLLKAKIAVALQTTPWIDFLASFGSVPADV
jgi:hypothetical protein